MAMKIDPERTWCIQIDRRQPTHIYHDVLLFLEELLPHIEGLEVEWTPRHIAEERPDQGALRDFIPVAFIHHTNTIVLEYIMEEVVGQFGWLVDIDRGRQQKT